MCVCVGNWQTKMGKETVFVGVTLAGLACAGGIVALQRSLQVFYDKDGTKLASPGLSILQG